MLIGKRKIETYNHVIVKHAVFAANYWRWTFLFLLSYCGTNCLPFVHGINIFSHFAVLLLQSIIKTASGVALIVAENQYTSDLDGSIPVLITSVC